MISFYFEFGDVILRFYDFFVTKQRPHLTFPYFCSKVGKPIQHSMNCDIKLTSSGLRDEHVRHPKEDEWVHKKITLINYRPSVSFIISLRAYLNVTREPQITMIDLNHLHTIKQLFWVSFALKKSFDM